VSSTPKRKQEQPGRRLQSVPVERIRPENGLARRRDRVGHQELCRSIEQFGVLTPITVRLAPDGSGDYLLIKGQGRTLACRLLGLATIPAIVVDEAEAEREKVQQFLVENVARLRMAPVDRALLIARARHDGEETTDVAIRFGVTSSTVRRLEAQLDGASSGEVAALRAGKVNLSVHAAIAKHVPPDERAAVIRCIAGRGTRANQMDALLQALDYRGLVTLGPEHQRQRLGLLRWAVETLESLPRSNPRERIRQMAALLPATLPEALDITSAEAAG
jgi:ParB family chromosome partitioning protein